MCHAKEHAYKAVGLGEKYREIQYTIDIFALASVKYYII